MARGRGSSLLLLLGSTALSLAASELGIRWLGAFPEPRSFFRDLGGLDEGRDAEQGAALRRAPHPWLGWTDVPGRSVYSPRVLSRIFPEEPPSSWVLRNNRVNREGFGSARSSYAGLGEDSFVVGIFGGSVAKDVAAIGGERLAVELARRLELPREAIAVLNFGAGGYKQPQQLIALVQMALLGVPFDLVLNVDGYNEVVAGARDSARGQHPLLPSQVHYGPLLELLSRDPGAAALQSAAAALGARRRADGLRRMVLGSTLLRSSELARALLGALALASEREATRIEARLQEEAQPATVLARPDLPEGCVAGAPCWESIVGVWERGSRLMASVAGGLGARYLHVLQPNPYVEGAEALVLPRSAPRYELDANIPRWVRTGYPQLREAGRRLSGDGIAFHDLSRLFAPDSRVYRDPCCHFDRRGNELLAEHIAGLVGPSP